MATLDHLHENAESLRQAYAQAVAERDQAQQEVKSLYATSENLLERMHQKDRDAEQARSRYDDLQQEISRAEAAEAVTRSQQDSCDESIARLQEEDRSSQQRLEGLRQQIEEKEASAKELGRQAETLAEKIRSAGNVIAGRRMKRDRCEETLQDLRRKSSAAAMDQRSAEDRIRLLEDMEREYRGYSNAVRSVMQASRGQRLRGICGPVADLVRADDRYAAAIETALGAALQNIVVETQGDAKAAIEMLKRNKTGRCTFLPVDVMDGRILRDEDFSDPGCVGVAFDLAQFDLRYRGIFANLLGRTLVAETLSDAIRISNAEHHAVRIVTLDGQMIHAGGSMTGGSSVKNAGFLTRANELERLHGECDRLREEAEALEEKAAAARTEFVNAENALKNAQEDRQELEKERALAEAQQQSEETAAGQFRALLESLSADATEKSRTIEAHRAQKQALEETLRAQKEQTQKLRRRLEKLDSEIKSLTASRMELEGRRSRSDRKAQKANEDLIELERTVSRCEQKKEQADLEEKQILDKLWDTYELSHSAAEEIRRPVSSLTKANREIAALRRRISALGTPNLGAIDEFKRVNERYTFLAGQRDDVTKSRRELQSIIGDITREMEKIFAAEFEKIRAEFQRIFVELFGGGRADLRLEDPEHVLDCGIEIRVQPPGKSLKNLSLLSGGETAYVAIALYFAILCVRPTPFCVMDEIEAALDEANVSRFAKYLQKMSAGTQFIVITHRRGTIERRKGTDMGLFDKMLAGLHRTKSNLADLEELFQNYAPDREEFYDDLEELLIVSDAGVETAEKGVREMRTQTWEERYRHGDEAREGLIRILTGILDVQDPALHLDTKPSVILMVGVNGVGKTTTIGKLAKRFTDEGKTVLLAAADTFRAAAAEQLTEWAKRSGAGIICHEAGSDPGAVVFDSIQSAKARGTDLVIVDTAGRLHNKQNLMNELNKITRILQRELPEGSIETLMVLDATTGQNGLEQAKQFLESAGITGIVLTKLDGTAKGGVVFSIAEELKLPVKFIGVGEKVDDLIPFDSKAYVEALFR